jgi:murein DD-endopeptidase MepM/ murein hydrolase activator NlpD
VTETFSPQSPRHTPEIGKWLANLLESTGIQRFGGHLLLLGVAVGVIGLGRLNMSKMLPAQMDVSALMTTADDIPLATPIAELVSAPAVAAAPDDITRLTDIHTFIPDRARFEITTYVAQDGDTILGIAEKFALTPETIVFGNPILRDNPHLLAPGQELRIAPANGIIRDVFEGDTIGGLATAYKILPEDIINWPSNDIDPENPQISVGQTIFAPGGTRGLLTFPELPSTIASSGSGTSTGTGSTGGGTSIQPSSTTPLVLRSGGGQCAPGLGGGVAGSSTFVYPTNNHFISGYDYSGIHPGIDLDGENGEPVYAADSGVVVFAGWSDWGFGNTIIIDHGNSWWTLYGHLSSIFVSCGQGAYQGNQIGAIGNTGASAGAHLHFEVYYGIYQTNPWGVLP